VKEKTEDIEEAPTEELIPEKEQNLFMQSK